MNYCVLENGDASVFDNIKRKAINELYADVLLDWLFSSFVQL